MTAMQISCVSTGEGPRSQGFRYRSWYPLVQFLSGPCLWARDW